MIFSLKTVRRDNHRENIKVLKVLIDYGITSRRRSGLEGDIHSEESKENE